MRRVLLLVLLLTGVGAAQTTDSDSEILILEITEHVIDRCYLRMLKNAGLDEFMTEEEALILVKSMEADNVKAMIDAVLPLVEGKQLAVRMPIYEISAQACISGAEGATEG